MNESWNNNPDAPINSDVAVSRSIAVVDDEHDIVELISLNLVRSGFKVKKYYDAGSFIKSLKFEVPDLLLLDLMLPDTDGFEVCRYLKRDNKYQSIHVIILTAKGEETDKVVGLELGADDYITKPFSPRELVARVKAVLRRDSGSPQEKNIRIAGNLEIDLQKYEVRLDGNLLALTSSEFKILKLLSERKGWVFSREQILDTLGANEKGVLDRTVDVHIKNLREKLGKSGKMIKNIRGIGYKIDILD